MILEGFLAILINNVPLQAFTHDADDNTDRIHYGNRPQGEREPAIVLQLVGETPGAVMGPKAARYTDGTVRLNCFGRTLLEAGDVADAATAAVHCFKGTAGAFNFGSVFASSKTEIPRIVPEGKSGPDVFGVSVDAAFVLKT